MMGTIQTITLTSNQYQSMLLAVESTFPEEACGMVGGKNGLCQSIFPITNIRHSRDQFLMAPDEQLRVLIWLEDHGQDLIAIYHSHPDGPPFPSRRDILEFSYPGVVYMIWTLHDTTWNVRGYNIKGDSFNEITINCDKQA